MQLLNWNTINFSVIYFWKNVENYNFCWKNEITVNLALKNPLNGQSKTTVANDIQYIYLQSICIFQNWVEGQTMWRIGRKWPFVFVKVRLKSQIWRCLSWWSWCVEYFPWPLFLHVYTGDSNTLCGFKRTKCSKYLFMQKYVLRDNYVPDTILDASDMWMNKQVSLPAWRSYMWRVLQCVWHQWVINCSCEWDDGGLANLYLLKWRKTVILEISSISHIFYLIFFLDVSTKQKA